MTIFCAVRDISTISYIFSYNLTLKYFRMNCVNCIRIRNRIITNPILIFFSSSFPRFHAKQKQGLVGILLRTHPSQEVRGASTKKKRRKIRLPSQDEQDCSCMVCAEKECDNSSLGGVFSFSSVLRIATKTIRNTRTSYESQHDRDFFNLRIMAKAPILLPRKIDTLFMVCPSRAIIELNSTTRRGVTCEHKKDSFLYSERRVYLVVS